MAERPILFSAPMVRALLAGRKTQTRRVVKLRGAEHFDHHEVLGCVWPWSPEADDWVPCPYGAPGDRLWVRETWGSVDADHPRTVGGRKPQRGDRLVFRANPADDYQWGSGKGSLGDFVWRPSIYMPRWASRITLEVTGVHVERLQAISEAGAAAEGLRNHGGGGYADAWWPEHDGLAKAGATARAGFELLWKSINGAESWAANPWVWVVEFKRVTP